MPPKSPPSPPAVLDALAKADRQRNAGHLSRAIEPLRLLLETYPDDANLWFAFGNLARDTGHTEDAAFAYKNVIRMRPGSVEAGSNLVHVLITLNRPKLAANLARDIAKVGLRMPEVAQSVADAFARLSLYDEACRHYRRMLCLHPHVARGSANLAESLARMGDDDSSLIWAERARVSDPADDQVAFHHAMALMTTGHVQPGLAAYEARLRPGATRAPERRGLMAPRWDGGNPGGTLMVLAEQGLGDEIRFASALPKLLERGLDVIVECEPRLVTLFQRSFPDIRVVPHTGRRTGAEVVFDYGYLSEQPAAYIEAGSLPLMLGLLKDGPIAEGGFLVPDPVRVDMCLHQLWGQADGPVIGLVWGSAVTHPERARFYPALKHLQAILTLSGVRFVNLQYIDAAADLERFRKAFGVTVIDMPDIDKRYDLDGAAALAAACDLVVGVSSSVTAMAAAIGTPTLEMLPERTWLPRFEDPAGDNRDGYLGLCRRVEFEATVGAPTADGTAWQSVTERAARMIPRLLNLA
jgi:tetratricopeptide (TPR) repeat protein